MSGGHPASDIRVIRGPASYPAYDAVYSFGFTSITREGSTRAVSTREYLGALQKFQNFVSFVALRDTRFNVALRAKETPRMTTREQEDRSGILGLLVSVLARLERHSKGDEAQDKGGVADGTEAVEGIWRDLVDYDHTCSDSSGAPAGTSHGLLPEYAFRECRDACFDLVVGLGEASTLSPLVRLMQSLNGDDAPEAAASLRKKIHVVSTLRVVLSCVEQGGLYFSLQGAREVVNTSCNVLESASKFHVTRKGVKKQERELVRQLSVLLQLELIKLLLMMSRRYAEVFDENEYREDNEDGRGDGAGERMKHAMLVGVLMGIWAGSEDDSMPASWVRDETCEVAQRESSLLQNVMSLVGSRLSLSLGRGNADRRGENDVEEIDGGDDDMDGPSLEKSPRGHHERHKDYSLKSTGSQRSLGPQNSGDHLQKEVMAGYDAGHPLQALSALLMLTLCFTVPAFTTSISCLWARQGSIPPTSPKALLETLSNRMADSESSRLLMYVLLQNNKEFMNYCMSRTDVDVIVMPLLERLYKHVDREATGMNELYIMSILLLVMTGDQAFALSANGSIVKDRDLAWYTTRNIKGIRLDSLMLLVLLHVAMVTTYSPSRRDVYLHTTTLATIANIAPTMSDMHPVACQRLMAVLEKLGSTAERLYGGLEVAVDRELLGLLEEFRSLIFEVINAIIEKCLKNNVALVYAMLHKRSAIDRYMKDEHQSRTELRELSENAHAVVEYFTKLLVVSESEPSTPMSIETIQEIIKEGMKSFRYDELPMDTSELRFGYEEEADSSTFFLPYIERVISAILQP
jgi:hypothetical protein